MILKAAIAIIALGGVARADTLLVGNKGEHTVSFIDLETGEEVARRETGLSPHEIAVSPDGKLAVVVSYRTQNYTGNTLHVFDIETAEKVRVIDLGASQGPHGLKWIPGTREVIATTEVTEDVVIANVDTGEVTALIKSDQQGTHMVALSPDATTAYAASIGSGSFTIFDLQAREKIRDVKAGEGTEAITVSPDGAEIWVGNNNSQSIMIFGADDFEMIGEIETDDAPIRVEMNPAGTLVAVSYPRQARLVVFDAATRDKVADVDLGENGQVPVTILWAEDGTKLWVAATGSQTIVEVDAGDWSVIRELAAGQQSDGLGYSPLDVMLTD